MDPDRHIESPRGWGMKPFLSLPRRLSRLIGDGVADARGREALEAQAAGGAPAAGVNLVLVARPGEFEGRPQLMPQAHDPPLVQVDQGGVDEQGAFRAGCPTR